MRRIGLLIGSLVLVASLASPAHASINTQREGTQTFDRRCSKWVTSGYCNYTPNVPQPGDLRVNAYRAQANLTYHVTRPTPGVSLLLDVDVFVSNVQNCQDANFQAGYDLNYGFVDVLVEIGKNSAAEQRCTVVKVVARWSLEG